MMYASVDGQRRLAWHGGRGKCPSCEGEMIAKCGLIRIEHWAHQAEIDCDEWSEPESEWHLGWKKHAPTDRTEVVIEKNGKKHRADILCANSAVLELQSSAISPVEIREREEFYKYMAWLFRVTWADRLHYGKKGFWWKHGAISQTFITKPLFWHYEDENIVQEVKLARVEQERGGDRVVGRAVKTYKREQFAEFVATGKVST
jgi:competence CoiA-like predicted nuclease